MSGCGKDKVCFNYRNRTKNLHLELFLLMCENLVCSAIAFPVRYNCRIHLHLNMLNAEPTGAMMTRPEPKEITQVNKI
jgi:hypothetical protein